MIMLYKKILLITFIASLITAISSNPLSAKEKGAEDLNVYVILKGGYNLTSENININDQTLVINNFFSNVDLTSGSGFNYGAVVGILIQDFATVEFSYAKIRFSGDTIYQSYRLSLDGSATSLFITPKIFIKINKDIIVSAGAGFGNVNWTNNITITKEVKNANAEMIPPKPLVSGIGNRAYQLTADITYLFNPKFGVVSEIAYIRNISNILSITNIKIISFNLGLRFNFY